MSRHAEIDMFPKVNAYSRGERFKASGVESIVIEMAVGGATSKDDRHSK